MESPTAPPTVAATIIRYEFDSPLKREHGSERSGDAGRYEESRHKAGLKNGQREKQRGAVRDEQLEELVNAHAFRAGSQPGSRRPWNVFDQVRMTRSQRSPPTPGVDRRSPMDPS